MLGDIELQQVQFIRGDHDQVLAAHEVPSLEGNFWQGLGRRGGTFSLSGVLTGAGAGEGLAALGEKFHAAAPVSFVADIADAGRVDQVLIEAMRVREIAGHPLRFEYAFRLKEYAPPPAVPQEPPPEIPPPLPLDEATLIVEVVVAGEPGFDHSETVVTVEGTREEGGDLSRTLTGRQGNVWTEEEMPPGTYTCRATVDRPEPLTGTAQAEVRAGETTRVVITLRPGAVIAKAYIVHFWFDKAFIEPCMRAVLRGAADHAARHPDEKVVIVGHTDLVGSDAYNQSLSERRARSVYAWLTAGRDRAAGIAEWEELRRPRPAGQLPSLHDTWSTREYQFILHDLAYYRANIDEDHGPLTSEAVRAFQLDQGLPQTGQVDDATWSALIAAYLDQDRLAVPEDQFIENSGDGCNNGVIKWLGCGEKDPVRNTRDAWRPNRRTEILFVRAESFPCEVAEPETWDLPAPGGDWCIGPGDPARRCCFLARGEEQPDTWRVQPAEPERITVDGTVTFEDGSPVAGEPFALLSPEGEYLHTDAAGNPDLGERPAGAQRGRPIPDRTGSGGEFSYPRPTPVGTYMMRLPELQHPAVARLAEAPPEEARGNVVCKRLDTATAPDGYHVVIQAGPLPAAPVNPAITPARGVVVVGKAHTTPARVRVTLATDRPFSRTGTLTRSNPIVRFFDAATGGAEITFDGTDNVFSGAQLSAGVTLFAESSTASGTADDVQLTLTLAPGSTPVGPPALAFLTAVELTLDIHRPRTSAGVTPPALSEADKIAPGRFVQVRDPRFTHDRTLVTVRSPVPADFSGNLELTLNNGRIAMFRQEAPNAGQPQVVLPHAFPAPGADTRFWIEGTGVSGSRGDTILRLGVQGVEPDGDRVVITTLEAALVRNTAPFAAAIDRAQIEGVLNRDRAQYDIGDLFGNQADSLFRARADIPGVAGNTVPARIVSTEADGTAVETRAVTLTRTTGDRFVSLPLLAIPMAIPRGDITFRAPQDIEVVRARAEGDLRLELRGAFTGLAAVERPVRGRVLEFCTITIQGAAPTIGADMTTANRVMAQCGIEFRILDQDTVNNGALLDIQQANCPLTIGGDTTRGAEEQALFNLGRADCAENFIVYFVRSNSLGAFGCSAYPTGQPGVTVADTASQYTFAHEIGHVLHLPHDGRADNLMTGAGTNSLPANPNQVHLLPDQCRVMNNSGFLVFRE
jgi:outer membrane protein OmpA-like peptidoglycan-associated protein